MGSEGIQASDSGPVGSHLASLCSWKMRVRRRPPISAAGFLPDRREKYFGSAGGALLAKSAKHAAPHAAGSSNNPGEAAANSSSAANCSIPGQGEQPAAVAGKSEPAVRYFVMGCRCPPTFVNQSSSHQVPSNQAIERLSYKMSRSRSYVPCDGLVKARSTCPFIQCLIKCLKSDRLMNCRHVQII